jgi:hypothetical protein
MQQQYIVENLKGFETQHAIQDKLNEMYEQGYRFICITPEGFYLFERSVTMTLTVDQKHIFKG